MWCTSCPFIPFDRIVFIAVASTIALLNSLYFYLSLFLLQAMTIYILSNIFYERKKQFASNCCDGFFKTINPVRCFCCNQFKCISPEHYSFFFCQTSFFSSLVFKTLQFLLSFFYRYIQKEHEFRVMLFLCRIFGCSCNMVRLRFPRNHFWLLFVYFPSKICVMDEAVRKNNKMSIEEEQRSIEPYGQDSSQEQQ